MGQDLDNPIVYQFYTGTNGKGEKMSEHNHEHTHSPMGKSLSSGDLNRAFYAGIILNVIFIALELIYGYKVNSTGLISDAVHNIGDVLGLFLALLAYRLLSVASSRIFTYGFRRVSILASFASSLFLAVAVGGIILEGIHRILNPKMVDESTVMIIAGIGILINFGSAVLFRNHKEDDLNIKAAYWHLMADALVSLGVVVSGAVIYFTHWYFMDGLISVVIAFVILFSAWDLFRGSAVAIMDGVPSHVQLDDLKKHLKHIKGVIDIHHLHVWNLSTNQIALTCHVQIDSIENMLSVKNDIKEELNEHNIQHSTLEFDLNDDDCSDKVNT
jgi:cobalt-zinc-cadmium efflux system protein